MSGGRQKRISKTLCLLNKHHEAFFSVSEVAKDTGHPVPMDTRGWSQIIVSVLTGKKGLERKKGPDLADGSDVKAANTWEAIDAPRFNGVIKAGTQATNSDSIDYLNATPFLFLVLWDKTASDCARCRIWVVRPSVDPEFRGMCERWYAARAKGEIKSTNFQLHPPRGQDSNQIRNTFGNLEYPLLLSAVYGAGGYELACFNGDAVVTGVCTRQDRGLMFRS